MKNQKSKQIRINVTLTGNKSFISKILEHYGILPLLAIIVNIYFNHPSLEREVIE